MTPQPGFGRALGKSRTPGVYIILFRLPTLTEVRVGRLGTFDLVEGRYAYVGSALNGLEARTERHLRGEGKKRWHIDYLMDRAVVKEALLFPGTKDVECSLAERVRRTLGATEPIDRFGSSDCRCYSHLFMLDDRAEAALRNEFEQLARDRG